MQERPGQLLQWTDYSSDEVPQERLWQKFAEPRALGRKPGQIIRRDFQCGQMIRYAVAAAVGE